MGRIGLRRYARGVSKVYLIEAVRYLAMCGKPNTGNQCLMI